MAHLSMYLDGVCGFFCQFEVKIEAFPKMCTNTFFGAYMRGIAPLGCSIFLIGNSNPFGRFCDYFCKRPFSRSSKRLMVLFSFFSFFFFHFLFFGLFQHVKNDIWLRWRSIRGARDAWQMLFISHLVFSL